MMKTIAGDQRGDLGTDLDASSQPATPRAPEEAVTCEATTRADRQLAETRPAG
jgi:hypothetical protein